MVPLALSDCADRRPTWSLSDAAADSLALEAHTHFEPDPTETPAGGECRAILSLGLPNGVPQPVGQPTIDKAQLARAKNVRFECLGGCDEAKPCKLQHTVESPDPQWATTSCVCDPSLLPPCRLTVRWTIGEETRRRIERVGCEETGGPGSCGLSLSAKGESLQITCEPRVP